MMHYQAIERFEPDTFAALNKLNNIGIVYCEWDMPIRQVFSYKKAIENGNTLADASLAHEYIGVVVSVVKLK